MKSMRFVFKLILWIIAVLVIALLTMPIWFGPVVKTVANATVPGVVKTDFKLGHLSLNPYTARFELGDLVLGNPAGYTVKEAVKVGSVVFDAETASLVSDVIHVEEVTIKDICVSLVTGGENKVLNFKQIQYNVAGGKEKYEAGQAEKKAKIASADNVTPEAKTESGRDKKVIIDIVEISGLKLHLGLVQVPLPPLTLKDIGRKSGGCTLEEAWQQIVEAVMKSAGIIGDQLKAFGALTGDATKQVNKAITETTGRAQEALGGATKSVTAVTESTSAVVGEAAGKAVGTAGETLGAGTKAIGDGAKKTLDALKKLW